MGIAIKVENLSKAYQLGEIGTGTLSRDLERYWAKLLGKEDPFLKIGETNDRTVKGESDIVWSLKDINFEIEQGDAVGIIGRNGAGKSTLLKILSRVTSPTTGNIKIKGRVASLLEVGTGFHPELSGRENIFLNGAILGMRKAEIKKHFDAIVDFSGVERYIDTPVKRYSSGMYVRLAFAVAAHLESEILVVDEVLAVGDAEFQKKCLGKMNEVSKGEGRTVLFVSHNMAAVQNLCKNAIILKQGKVEFCGNTNLAISNYILYSDSIKEVDIFTDKSKRKGTGDVKVVSIKLKDDIGNSIDSVAVGKGFSIVFKFQNKYPNKQYRIIPGVAIKTTLDTPVALHHSRLQGKIYDFLPSEGEITFEIPQLLLAPNVYTFVYSILNDGELVDTIDHSFELNVIDSNYYGHGETPPNSHGIVLLDGNWY